MDEMSYENAPATKMVATNCCCCGRPLVDSVSVEAGVGPDCREKYGYVVEGVSAEAQAEANKVVHSIACAPKGANLVEGCKRLHELGFDKLVLAILRKTAAVKITVTDASHPHGAGRLAVRVPYSEAIVNALKGVQGRRWDSEAKVNTFPAESRGALWTVFRNFYKGAVAVGPKGPFVIGVVA